MVLRKRAMVLIMAVVLLLPGFAFQENQDKASYVIAGFDDTSMRQWESNRFFTRMEEWTGISFTYRQYTDMTAWKQAKAAMQTGGDLPDVLFKANLTPSECIELREKGVLIDLKPYLEEYAPHVWAILQENPAYMDAVTLPDGSIAALPYINSLPSQNYIWINQQWLNTLHLDMPQTAQELTDVLNAFKTRDPNRNGKADEIPLSFLGPFDLKFLAHAYGMICNDYNIYLDEHGKVQFMPLHENFRMFVSWCRDLYDAGLLDKNGFSTADTFRKVTEEKTTPVYGAIFATAPSNLFQVTWSEQYVALAPLTYDGKQIYRNFFGPLQRGTFALTSACGRPEELLKWVDILYTEEGAILTAAGQENLDYLVDGDGTWRLVDSAQSNTSAFIASSLMEGGASMPGITASEFIRRYSGQTQAQLANIDRQTELLPLCVQPVPYVSLSKAQEEEIAVLQNQIGEYVDTQMGRWILGEEEISDASFAAFENKLKELGLPEFMSFWQGILEK